VGEDPEAELSVMLKTPISEPLDGVFFQPWGRLPMGLGGVDAMDAWIMNSAMNVVDCL
jgi:hypothetical protein